jgi:excisionase family DNA binding protein
MAQQRQSDLALLSLRQAAKLVGIDRGFLGQLIHEGRIKTVQVGSHKKIPVWALREWQERAAA